MGKTVGLIMALLLFAGIVGGDLKASAAASEGKKAILVVSFGTTYPDTHKTTIESTENKIRAAFPDYEVRRAFTSRIIIKKLLERDNVKIETEKEALLRLKAEGYSEVIVQPLHIVAGAEYDKIKGIVAHLQAEKAFKRIELSRPLLYYPGVEGHPDDYSMAIKAAAAQFPKLGRRDAVVFLGHGGPHPANAAYATLQMKFADNGMDKVFVYTVEGYPDLDWVIAKLKETNRKKITLMPFMLVAGDHANNDMAGDEEDSAKSILTAAGFKVEPIVKGLGENPAIQDIYVQHIKDAIAKSEEK